MDRTDPRAPACFEGTEKKVEMVLDPAAGSLRARGRGFWQRVVEACDARILSHIANDRLDAWLLSESSLFVWDHKMVMITCGRTRLTASARELLREIPLAHVRFFAYERKNEVFPHEQPTSFLEDARELGELMPGSAFQFANKDEHHLQLFHLDRHYEPDGEDCTLQVLMHGLPPEVRRLFGPDSGLAAPDVAEATGLDGVLAGAVCDAHLFEPRGYSLNAIRDEHYATVHVTPDEGGSYASFESNLPFRDGSDALVRRLLDVFRPRSFDLVFWEPAFAPPQSRLRGAGKATRLRQGYGGRAAGRPVASGFQVSSHVTRELSCGYHVQFVHLFRPDGKPRTAYAVELRNARAPQQEVR